MYIRLISGIALSSAALVILSIFAARMKAGMLIASRFGTEGLTAQSGSILVLSSVLFIYGVLLVMLAVNNIISSRRSASKK